MSLSSLSNILKENKLTGENYTDWSRNLKIVLVAEGFNYVIEQECPAKPTVESTEADRAEYARWLKSDEMARCYILASMSNVLQHQHRDMKSAYDIITSLKELFGRKSRTARHLAIKQLMGTKMASSTPVRDHVLKMMGYLSEIEILGAEMDGETQIDIVLHSLPPKFEQFRMNFQMMDKNSTLAELLGELQAAELLMGQGAEENVATAGKSFSTSGKRKRNDGGKSKNMKVASNSKKRKVRKPIDGFQTKNKCFK